MAHIKLFISFLTICLGLRAAQAANLNQQASDLVRKTEDNLRGRSQKVRLVMQVINQGTTRSIKFDFWSKDRDKVLIKVLEPVKEENSGNLRIELNLWRYLANVDRIIKVPPSMMLQSWMGSDFSYDDMMKTSSLASDYTHQWVESQNGIAKIICTPLPNAPVVWGKVIEWIREKDLTPDKREFYSEKGKLIKTMTASDIKTIGSHRIPMNLVMVNHQKDGLKTILNYRSLEMDGAIDASIFTQQKLKERK